MIKSTSKSNLRVDRYGDTEHFSRRISRLLAAQILFSFFRDIGIPLKRKPVFLPPREKDRKIEVQQ